jgi:hypothetical protein
MLMIEWCEIEYFGPAASIGPVIPAARDDDGWGGVVMELWVAGEDRS